MSGLRPSGVTRPAVVLAGLGAAFTGIARTTGAGWVVVLVCGVIGSLAVGALWPPLALRGADVRVTPPRDATVGRPVAVDVHVVAGGRGLRLQLVDPASGWVTADPPGRGEVLATPARRGVVQAIDVEVRSAAPLGLVTWRRRVRVELRVPLEVGPRPIETPLELTPAAGSTGGDAVPRGRRGHIEVRGVREYVPGDSLRLVHWPSTARRGALMVKELEDPDVPRLALVVDLRGDPAAAERAASRAAGLAGAALQAGVPVTLLTAEPGGPVAAEVSSPVEAGRRLARAVAGPPPEGPVPDGAVVQRVAAGAARPPGPSR